MIRVGIIGNGIIAREHAEAIGTLPKVVTLRAAAEIVPERLRSFCDRFHVPRAYATAAELIADRDVDLVTIATPPNTHESFVIAALDAGKFVLCEKPLAHSMASAARIVDAGSRHPGRLAVSHQLRYHRGFRRLVWVAQSGWIGQARSAFIQRHGSIPHAENGKSGWWGAWGVAGGGVLVTQVVHELDLLLLALGPARSVRAEMDTIFSSIESEDSVDATIHFENGATAKVAASVNSGLSAGGFSIRGTEGSVMWPWDFVTTRDAKAAERAMDAALPTHHATSGIRGWVGRVLGNSPNAEVLLHALLYSDIADSIAAGRPLPIPASDAMRSLELCMAIYESALTGKEVTLPLSEHSVVRSGVSAALYARRPKATRSGNNAAV